MTSMTEYEKPNRWGLKGTRGERRIRELATSKGLELYRGHGFGCSPLFERDGDGAWQAYSILDPSLPLGEHGTCDNQLVLCMVTLPDAEAYLRDGVIPQGHALHESSGY